MTSVRGCGVGREWTGWGGWIPSRHYICGRDISKGVISVNGIANTTPILAAFTLLLEILRGSTSLMLPDTTCHSAVSLF